jgi:hypothetical protein
MVYSLKQASEAAGVGKPALLKAIKKGRISGNKNSKGQWEIDPSELHRVYPVNSNQSVTSERRETQEEPPENSYLQRENELLREQLNDLKEDRDYWRQQATALITDTRPQRTSVWRRFFGKS